MEKRKKRTEELSLEPALRQDLRLFAMLARPEADFLAEAAELEADPLFARLLRPGPGGRAPLRRRALPGASYAFAGACGDDSLAAAAASAGAGEWVAARPEMLRLAQRVGAAAFERHVLAGPGGAAAARACGLTQAEFEALRAFAAAFTLAHEHTPPAALPPRLLRCAAQLREEGGALVTAYTHPAYFRGAYAVDGAALAALLKGGTLSRAEAARVRALASAAQRVAWRKAGFHRVLTALAAAQKDFLLGRGPLKPLTQRALAAGAGLNPATVSRLLAGRSVLTPAGAEVALKDLFMRRGAFIIDRIKAVLGAGNEDITDARLAAELKKKYGLRVPRRTVNLYRNRI